MSNNVILKENTTITLLEYIQTGGEDKVPARLRLLFDPATMADDSLDVSILFPFARKENCILKFDNLPPVINEAARIFARLTIFVGRAPYTANAHVRRLKKVFGQAAGRFQLWDYRQLDVHQFQALLNECGDSAGEKSRVCTSVYFFYRYMSSFCGETVEMDMNQLESMRRRWSALEAATSMAHRTPDIDDDYYETLENELPVLASRTDLPIEMRIAAAGVMLDMNVGLRPSEFVRLTVDAHEVRTAGNGRQADYLLYSVPKLSHGGRQRTMARCYMLPGAVTAFELLLELRKLVPGHGRTKRLFIFPGMLDVSERAFRTRADNLFRRYLTGLSGNVWRTVKCRKIDGKNYYIPNLTQYRVHLCSFLYRQGVSLNVIEMGMSHLTETMIAYYYRTKDRTFAAQQQRADNVIRSRMNNDFALTDVAEKGEELLMLLPLSLSQFGVYSARLEEVTAKGYDYEADRYTKSCRNKISTEIRPALSYLNRIIWEQGFEAVVGAHPALRHIAESMESINETITEWERQHTK